MPYIQLTDVTNHRQPRAFFVNTSHIQVIGVRKVAHHGDRFAEDQTYVEIAGRASNIDVGETPGQVLTSILDAEAGYA
jgi:hypothetical protein